MKYNVMIIGSGPAGLTAGIYTARAKLSTVILKGSLPGGQLTTTAQVENWPGEISILGTRLIEKMMEHARLSGCVLRDEVVKRVDFANKPYAVITNTGKRLTADCIIIATGSIYRKLGVPGENEYWGRGVSVCSVCDAPLYQGKKVVIVGGGNTAMTEAYYLADFAKEINVITRDSFISATDPVKDRVLVNPKVKIFYDSKVKWIKGNKTRVTSVIIENLKTGKELLLKTNGVFIAIGLIPNSEIFRGELDLDEKGYVKKYNDIETSKNGIFVAGDVADPFYRQAITAAGQGCMAALACQRFLSKRED